MRIEFQLIHTSYIAHHKHTYEMVHMMCQNILQLHVPSIYFLASFPNSVPFLTCCLSSSPVLTCRNCGKLCRILPEMVPLPPPGLPRMRRECECKWSESASIGSEANVRVAIAAAVCWGRRHRSDVPTARVVGVRSCIILEEKFGCTKNNCNFDVLYICRRRMNHIHRSMVHTYQQLWGKWSESVRGFFLVQVDVDFSSTSNAFVLWLFCDCIGILVSFCFGVNDVIVMNTMSCLAMPSRWLFYINKVPFG